MALGRTAVVDVGAGPGDYRFLRPFLTLAFGFALDFGLALPFFGPSPFMRRRPGRGDGSSGGAGAGRPPARRGRTGSGCGPEPSRVATRQRIRPWARGESARTRSSTR